MTETDRAYNLFRELQRQYPLLDSTLNTCPCGRMGASGASRCVMCVTDELASIVGPLLASQAQESLKEVARTWREIREACE